MATPRTVEVRTTSAAHTRTVARALAGLLGPGDAVLLVGDLGAGKTTFTQGLAAGLGVEEQVTSPTFTLVRPYRCGGGTVIRTMLHADMYRLDNMQEVVDLALAEMLEDGGVAVIEWGDVAAPVLGPDILVVRIEPSSEEEARIITVELPESGRWSADDVSAALGSGGPER